MRCWRTGVWLNKLHTREQHLPRLTQCVTLRLLPAAHLSKQPGCRPTTSSGSRLCSLTVQMPKPSAMDPRISASMAQQPAWHSLSRLGPPAPVVSFSQHVNSALLSVHFAGLSR